MVAGIVLSPTLTEWLLATARILRFSIGANGSSAPDAAGGKSTWY
jgi:hypothetical protein